MKRNPPKLTDEEAAMFERAQFEDDQAKKKHFVLGRQDL
jgi:hypothetical protein